MLVYILIHWQAVCLAISNKRLWPSHRNRIRPKRSGSREDLNLKYFIRNYKISFKIFYNVAHRTFGLDRRPGALTIKPVIFVSS